MDKPVDTGQLIADTAKECLQKSRDDLAKATEAMAKSVLADDYLLRVLMTPLVRAACYDRLRDLFQQRRKAIWNAPNYTKAGNGERLESLAATLLDFPLPHNMMRLGDAGKDDLVLAAEFYESRSEDMSHKARWLRLIADNVGRAKVASKFDAIALQRLQESAK